MGVVAEPWGNPTRCRKKQKGKIKNKKEGEVAAEKAALVLSRLHVEEAATADAARPVRYCTGTCTNCPTPVSHVGRKLRDILVEAALRPSREQPRFDDRGVSLVSAGSISPSL